MLRLKAGSSRHSAASCHVKIIVAFWRHLVLDVFGPKSRLSHGGYWPKYLLFTIPPPLAICVNCILSDIALSGQQVWRDRSRRCLGGAGCAALCKELGINPKTVAKRRKRETLDDRKIGPKEPRSTFLTEADEAMIVAFLRHSLLPLDDCLYALQPSIPHSHLPIVKSPSYGLKTNHFRPVGKPKRQKFKRYPFGFFHIDFAEVQTKEGKLYLFVGIGRTSKFAITQLVDKADRNAARDFLEHLLKAVPYRIHVADLLPGRRYAISTRGHNSFGASARNTWFTLSRGQGADVSGIVVLTTFPRTAPLIPICFIHCPTGYFRRKCPEREAVHGASRQRKALALHLVPRLADSVDFVIVVPDPLEFRAQLCVTLSTRRGF